MSAMLYGVGVGPGDPELLTLKAVRIMKACDVLVLPALTREDCVAYQIAVQAVPELAEKEVLPVSMPMTKDAAALERSHREAAERIEEQLAVGKTAAFLTLGDPTVYSTYLYVHKRVLEDGYPAAIISGVPSFCAVSARLGRGLVEKSEQLHVIPSSYQVEEALQLSGTRVLMKAGRKMAAVKQRLGEMQADVAMIENCGMPNEKIYYSAEEIPEDAGYYSLIIVKEKS